MNINPDRFTDLVRRVEQLSQQVTALFSLLGEQAKPRDSSIGAFCERKGISRSTYDRMRRRGLGPKETAVGLNRLAILPDDEDAWARERQEAVMAELSGRGANRYRSRAATRGVNARERFLTEGSKPRVSHGRCSCNYGTIRGVC